MRKLLVILILILMTCSQPPSLTGYDSDPHKRYVNNRIKIKGDSNHVEINYYWYRNDTIKIKKDGQD